MSRTLGISLESHPSGCSYQPANRATVGEARASGQHCVLPPQKARRGDPAPGCLSPSSFEHDFMTWDVCSNCLAHLPRSVRLEGCSKLFDEETGAGAKRWRRTCAPRPRQSRRSVARLALLSALPATSGHGDQFNPPPRVRAPRSGGSFAYRWAAPMSKSSDKPRKQQKKKPQKTLKERRSEKRAAKKLGSGSFLQADN
jgi:hypothetical protein